MESYPEDLLVGVSPLVFAVNALEIDVDSEAEPEGNATAASPKNRSDFDRFLDAMAGSLVDGIDEQTGKEELEFQPTPPPEVPGSGRNASLFRPDDDDDESIDDDFIFEDEDDENNNNIGGSNRRQNSIRLGFGLNRRSSNNPSNNNTTSYAKALQHGQGFFQRARIVAISTKHGFPPSKDPQGNKNVVFELKQARTSPQRAKELFTSHPIQGIVPAGWLEKHVYALPSVVLIVTRLSVNKSEQEARDSFLLKTVENLQHSLVPKRPCKIHVVCLVNDDVPVSQAENWSMKISRRVVDNPNTQQHQQDAHQITLLRASTDLLSGTDGFPISVALKRLHRIVRDSSLMYYLGLTRRTKEKLAKLSVGGKKKRLSTAKPQRLQPPNELLPLAIRYCFKISMYYEFQMKFEKSIRFMAEGYRHCRNYYHYLVRLTGSIDASEEKGDANKDRKHQTPTKGISNVSISTHQTEDTEVTIADSPAHSPTPDETDWTAVLPAPPGDMAHQCLAVADWLNFKLLQAGFGSHTEGGLLAAAAQWRQHSRVFLTRRFLGGHPLLSEEWLFWCHVAHQRLVMGQLVERHPPKALGDYGNEYDEVLLRCAPWRAYEAAAEAFLKAGVYVQKAVGNNDIAKVKGEKDDTRAPFIGGLDDEGLTPRLLKESEIEHKEKALELLSRAITMFEHDLEKEKLKDAEDQFPHRSWGRFGARLYYLAGGILVAKSRYEEARTYLEQAAKHSKGWDGIELAIRRLLVECYKKVPSTQEKDLENSQTMVPTMMESCFNANLTSVHLHRTLVKYSSICTTDVIKWSCECYDEFDPRLPFSFSVTFPGKSHATAGDSVMASVLLQSNLSYTVKVSSMTLLSLAGPLPVPSSDLGTAEGAVMQPGSRFVFTTKIELPQDLNLISTDEDDKKGTLGKNAFAKSARPRTAGITAAAGARLVSENVFGTGPRNSNAQWSLNFLGGKPLRCDGFRLVFLPCQNNLSSPATEAGLKPIEVTIEKKKPKTAANVKRTPFEEENYIASTWSRPFHLPLPSGPRCLRILGPMSEMEITNLTQSASGGRCVEGTVNRICLKLEAGPNEMCTEITYKVNLSSMLITKEGKTLNLTKEDSSDENTISMESPNVRAPSLVKSDPLSKVSQSSGYGHGLPPGWALEGSGQESDDRQDMRASVLKNGEYSYVFFELFRPSAVTAGKFAEETSRTAAAADDLCQTDFEVSVSYRQYRQRLAQIPEDLKPKVSDSQQAADCPKISEMVSQTFTGSVTWFAPLRANFYRCTHNTCPSGSRHPSNLTDEARPNDTSVFTNIPLIDGERISMRAVVEGDTEEDGFAFEIVKIQFEPGNDPESPCDLRGASLGTSGTDDALFHADKSDPCRWLTRGSKFSFVFSVQANMKNKNRSSIFPLGMISVDWLPRPFVLPPEVQAVSNSDISAHGPLPLPSPLTVEFLGPTCYIERAPFSTTFQCKPSIPKVAVPFQVDYSVANETNAHQKVSISLDGSPGSDGPEILVCGLLNGDLRLAPFETQVFSYTAIATKSGMTTLPVVLMSSSRYNSWVINEGMENARPLCILP